jgi:hypothetical protein
MGLPFRCLPLWDTKIGGGAYSFCLIKNFLTAGRFLSSRARRAYREIIKNQTVKFFWLRDKPPGVPLANGEPLVKAESEHYEFFVRGTAERALAMYPQTLGLCAVCATDLRRGSLAEQHAHGVQARTMFFTARMWGVPRRAAGLSSFLWGAPKGLS